MEGRSAPKRPHRIAVQAAALSLLLNLLGITWGLPFRFHPDEKAVSVERLIERGTLIPESFINPSLPLLLMAPVVALQDQAARFSLLSGLAADPLLACRLMSALSTAMAVLWFGVILERFAPGAMAAAFLLAAAPALVNFGHFATPESWLLLATVATLHQSLRHAIGEGDTRALGLGLGLAVSCKYTAAALVVPVALAVWLRQSRETTERPTRMWLGLIPAVWAIGWILRSGQGAALAGRMRSPGDARLLHPEAALSFVRGTGWWCLALGGIALAIAAVWPRRALAEALLRAGFFSALGFVLGTPGALLSPVRFVTDLAFDAQTRVEYKGFRSPESSWGAYAQLLSDSVGPGLVLAAVVGVVLVLPKLRRLDAATLIFLSSGVALFALVGASGHRAMRFLVPAIPCVVWLASRAILSVGSDAWRRGLAWALAIGTFGQAALMVRLFFVDSRIQAGTWLSERLGASESWGLISNFPGYGPRLEGALSMPALRTLSRELAPEEATRKAVEEVRRAGPEWLVVPEPYFARFVSDPDAFPEKAGFFRTLLAGGAGYSLSARFQQEGFLRPPNEFLDPEVLIFRRVP